MSELFITLPDGTTLPYIQALALGRKIEEFGPGNSHWHKNHCGCCLTIHGPDCAYVIDSEGGETFFASRGCDCDHGVTGQTE